MSQKWGGYARCGESTSEGGCKRKRDTDAPKKQSNTIEENECEVDCVYKKLLDKHDSKWRLLLFRKVNIQAHLDPVLGSHPPGKLLN